MSRETFEWPFKSGRKAFTQVRRNIAIWIRPNLFPAKTLATLYHPIL
jgi:hypothetical protein